MAMPAAFVVTEGRMIGESLLKGGTNERLPMTKLTVAPGIILPLPSWT